MTSEPSLPETLTRTEEEPARRPFRIPTKLEANALGLLATLLTLILYLFVFINDKAAHSPGSDGAYSWLWARSIVFDGDIDFANDYALCGDPLRQAIDRGTGKLDNPFYLGPALFWAPLLFVLKATLDLSGEPLAIAQACKGPLTMYPLALAPILGALAIWLSYRAARRFTSDGPAALAALAFGLGSSLYAYATVLPSYSHTYATFATSALILLTLRAGERPLSLFRWLSVGLFLGIAIVQRPTNIIFGLIPAAFAVLHLRYHLRTLISALTVVGLAALPFVLLQLAAYEYLYGHPLTTPQGPHYMKLSEPHPFLLLFAPHGGLFPTAPFTWLSVVGGAFLLRSSDTRVFAVTLLVISVLEIWVSSSALDWHGNWSYGARRLTTLTPIFIILAAVTLEKIAKALEARPRLTRTALGIACVLPLVFATTGAVWSLPRSGVPFWRGPSQGELWGQGTTVAWSLIDERLGTLASLPAEWAFSWRYGLPGKRFRAAAESPWYTRNYRSLRFYSQRLPLDDARLGQTMTGFSQDKAGAQMVRSRGRMVFAAQWRYATSYRLQGSAAMEGTRLRIGEGLAFGKVRWLGTITLGKRAREASVEIPKGAFSSGLNEIVFELVDAEPSEAGVHLSRITIEDATDHGPPLGQLAGR